MFAKANLQALERVEAMAGLAMLYIRETFSQEDEDERKLDELTLEEFEEMSQERLREVLDRTLEEFE